MRARIVVSVVLAAGLLLGTTGCTFFSEQATLKQYDPSDGVGAQVGSVKIRNAILLTRNDGRLASLLVDFINEGENPVALSIQYQSKSGKKTIVKAIPADGTRSFGGGDGEQQLQFTNVKATPGTLFPVYFQYGDATGKQVMVPVLDGSQKEYHTLLPTPKPTPTPTPTPTNIPGATLTPTPTPKP